MLLREYAIDPAVMADWEASKALYEGMGACHGRLWNPVWSHADWNNKAREQVDAAVASSRLGPVQGQSIKSKHLSHLKNTAWPVCPSIACQIPWAEAAERCHASHPFHAIVSPSHIREHPMLIPKNVSNHDSRWEPGPSVTTNRDIPEFVQAVDGILRASSKLVFIDPYFAKKFGNSAMKAPMQAYCRLACAGHTKRSETITKIEIHTERKNLGDAWLATSWASFKDSLSVQPTLVLWDNDTLHNRFILGNTCGVSFGHGLDTGAVGDERRETISRLSEASRKEHWDKHTTQTIAWRSDPTRVW